MSRVCVCACSCACVRVYMCVCVWQVARAVISCGAAVPLTLVQSLSSSRWVKEFCVCARACAQACARMYPGSEVFHGSSRVSGCGVSVCGGGCVNVGVGVGVLDFEASVIIVSIWISAAASGFWCPTEHSGGNLKLSTMEQSCGFEQKGFQ